MGAGGQTAIIDATGVRVRRPAAKQPDRNAFVSGKNKQNAIKAMVITDADGHLLLCGQAEPGSCADITQARKSGLVELLAAGPPVQIPADAGYQGLGADLVNTAAPQEEAFIELVDKRCRWTGTNQSWRAERRV
ncbi:transposase family protein [Actinomadura sp. NPDC048394]|uniref:transposase family protein n=1 Tax=Actinomadura sp. NPDC048394 TaxID=3158223 RepID=UPI0033EEF68F